MMLPAVLLLVTPAFNDTFQSGDSWTWEATLRYDDPVEGLIETERERWTLRVGPGRLVAAERLFVGSLVGETLVPSTGGKPEIVKGTVASDGTLAFKDDWSDPATARALRYLLKPDKKLDERVPGWNVLTHALIQDPKARIPGMDTFAHLKVEITLVSAKLGGREIKVPAARKGP